MIYLAATLIVIIILQTVLDSIMSRGVQWLILLGLIIFGLYKLQELAQ